jgi:aerobic C4-dicarboxylate transport protein
LRGPATISILPLALAIGAGLAFGLVAPAAAMRTHLLSDIFIQVLGWLVCPLIFCMLVDGTAALRRNHGLGRIGLAMFLYFGAMSLLSMLAGLLAGWLLEPGIQTAAAAGAGAMLAQHPAFDSHALPATNLIVLALAVPVGLAANAWPGIPLLDWIERARRALLAAVRMLLLLSPAAAFGAMASAAGRSGMASLLPLLRFVVAVNLVSIVFVLVVYGVVARLTRFSLPRFLVFLRDELALVAFTGASLAALTPLGEKLARLGCPQRLTDIVLPFSYSLNLAGTYLYIAIALVFLAEASHVHLGWHELAVMLGVGLLSSKGAAGVAGSAVATLAATAALLQVVPPDMVAMLVAIDRTMKCRLLTNVIGHALACVVVAARDGSLDRDMLAHSIQP